MNDSNLLTYIIVFLIVFVPYLFLQFCLDNKGKKKESQNLESIPPAFRLCYGLQRRFLLK